MCENERNSLILTQHNDPFFHIYNHWSRRTSGRLPTKTYLQNWGRSFLIFNFVEISNLVAHFLPLAKTFKLKRLSGDSFNYLWLISFNRKYKMNHILKYNAIIKSKKLLAILCYCYLYIHWIPWSLNNFE